MDVGCGTGNYLLWFASLGLKPFGVDPSPFMLGVAREKVRARVLMARAEALPFADGAFDLVTLVTTLEFVSDPLAALREAGRVARSKVFIEVLNRCSPFFLGQRLQGGYRSGVYSRAHFYSLPELKVMVQKALGQAKLRWDTVLSLPWRVRIDPHGPFPNPFGFYLGMVIEGFQRGDQVEEGG